MLHALYGKRSYNYDPKNLGLDPKYRATPSARLSIEEPLVLELNDLLSHLRYVFLKADNTLLVIIIIVDLVVT